MVLKMHSEWHTMDDYLKSMKTKFRTRAKSVYAKAQVLTIKSLSAKEILDQQNIINELFSSVLEKADFSFGALNAISFAEIKTNLNDNFIFRAFYLNDEMVGFSTATINNTVLEANFVGMNYEYNTDYCIYQRILFDYVEQAIDLSIKEVHLGRTAELIKSAIGAEPVHMKLYAKHGKSVSNLLLKPVIKSIVPSEFELRKPFKESFLNE